MTDRSLAGIDITQTDALIVVDPQNDFTPGGALAVRDGDRIMRFINGLAADFANAGAAVVVTQDYHPSDHKSFAANHNREPFSTIEMPYGEQVLWPVHCQQGTRGAEFHPEITPTLARADLIIRKGMNRDVDSYSAFYENDKTTRTGLTGYLRDRGITRVVVVGLAYDFCVGYSALDARRDGFEAVVVKSLTRSIAMPVLGATNTEDAMTDQLAAAGVTGAEVL